MDSGVTVVSRRLGALLLFVLVKGGILVTWKWRSFFVFAFSVLSNAGVAVVSRGCGLGDGRGWGCVPIS